MVTSNRVCPKRFYHIVDLDTPSSITDSSTTCAIMQWNQVGLLANRKRVTTIRSVIYARFSIWSPLCRYQVHCKQGSVKLSPTVKWLTMHLNYLSMWLHNSEHFLPQIACNHVLLACLSWE